MLLLNVRLRSQLVTVSRGILTSCKLQGSMFLFALLQPDLHVASLSAGLANLLTPPSLIGAIALGLPSAWDAAGSTPLGPLPLALRGCGVAAPRCRRVGHGVAVADPPPHVSGGLPLLFR